MRLIIFQGKLTEGLRTQRASPEWEGGQLLQTEHCLGGRTSIALGCTFCVHRRKKPKVRSDSEEHVTLAKMPTGKD